MSGALGRTKHYAGSSGERLDTMSVYRVTVPVTFVVEIDHENAEADPRPALRGNSPIVAVRRAIWCLLAKERHVEQQRLGIKRLLIKGRWENMDVAELKPEFASRPFASDAPVAKPATEEPEGTAA